MSLACYTLGAEQGQAYLMVEHLLIVLTDSCNEQATHTTSSRHFEVMHMNINAFKEITWIALNTALIITAILKQITYIILSVSFSFWNWTAEINLKIGITSRLAAFGDLGGASAKAHVWHTLEACHWCGGAAVLSHDLLGTGPGMNRTNDTGVR